MSDTQPETRPAHAVARAFIACVKRGELPEDMLTDDMTGWITTGGTVNKAAYLGMVGSLKHMLAGAIEMEIDAITAEGDRVVIESHGSATLVNGETYANTYVYVLVLRDGKIASVAEHYNALTAREKLVPLMASLKESR